MNAIKDRFTGKPIDKASDHFPHLNGGHCDECGSATIDHCPTCGAPQCCPKCCADATQSKLGVEVDHIIQASLFITPGALTLLQAVQRERRVNSKLPSDSGS